MHLVRFLVVLVLTSLLAACAVADGGILTFQPILPAGDPPLLPIENPNIIAARTATMRLDRNSTENVYVFNLQWPNNRVDLVLSKSEPYRLFCDLNGDRKAQASEITAASSSDAYTRKFENVPLPIPIENGSQTLHAAFTASVYSNLTARLQCDRIDSFYQGTLMIEGAEYPARLSLRSLEQSGNWRHSVIILDVNGDGVFNHFQDPWLNGSGTGLFGEHLWETETSINGATAEVALRSHQGPTGVVEWKGEAIYRAYLHVVSTTDNNRYRLNDDLCLPLGESRSTVLPEGQYRISKVWLRTGTSDQDFFQHSPQYYWGTGPLLRVASDATATYQIGGPLSRVVRIGNVSTLLGFVQLDLEKCRNRAGLEFTPVKMGEVLVGEQAPAPSYEIWNSKDKVVSSGQFEYG